MSIERAFQPQHSKAGSDALLTQLRAATASAHRDTERHPLIARLLSDQLSVADYRRVLSAFAGFYRALEERLPETLEPFAGAGYRYQRRTPLLEADLETLGTCPPPIAAPPLSPSNADDTLGALYVIEGSTQGGRVIGPRVCRQLALSPERGVGFFHLFRSGSWPRFCAMLERCAPAHRPEDVVHGALETFASLQAHFDTQLTVGESSCPSR